MGYSIAGGKLIDEKNQKRKISWHCPFNCIIFMLKKGRIRSGSRIVGIPLNWGIWPDLDSQPGGMNVVPANLDSQHCIKALKPVYTTHAIHVKSSALHLYININIDLIKLYFDSMVVLLFHLLVAHFIS
jgi:hypothetical protein